MQEETRVPTCQGKPVFGHVLHNASHEGNQSPQTSFTCAKSTIETPE